MEGEGSHARMVWEDRAGTGVGRAGLGVGTAEWAIMWRKNIFYLRTV